jgi:hypothetical protein
MAREQGGALIGFDDEAVPRCNALALGEPPNLTLGKTAAPPSRRAIRLGEPPSLTLGKTAAAWEVTVLANFGCQTTAGGAAARRDGPVLVLSARTILPDHPTPHCLCTRRLRFLVEAAGLDGVERIRYQQDARPAVDLEIK